MRAGSKRGTGTPFQAGDHTLVWTAAHVLDYKINSVPTVEIAGQRYDAEVIRLSKQQDVALLRLESRPATPLPVLLVWESNTPPPLGTPIDGRAGYIYGRPSHEGNIDCIGGKAVPGDSGTGLFVNGKYVGMVNWQAKHFPDTACWIVPSREIRRFCEQLNCRWAFGTEPAPAQIYPLFIGE